jgi:hypothetical protein
MKRFMLVTDDDAHWYLIPESDSAAFDTWIYEGGEELASAVRLAGSPSNVTFEAPQEFGRPIG